MQEKDPPPLFFDQNEARRAEKFFLETGLPPYLNVWIRHWGCNGLKNVTRGLRDVKEGGTSARKAGLLWGLSMKK